MNKFYIFIGKAGLKLISWICIVLVTSVIVISYYEDEKELIFFQIADYLDVFEQSILDEHTIYDAEDYETKPVTNI